MLALPAPVEENKISKAYDPSRLADLSKPRPRPEDPFVKTPRAPEKRKKQSRRMLLDQAKRVKLRQ